MCSHVPILERVAVFGDIHCEDVLLKQALDFLKTQTLDAYLCVGDVVDGLGDVDKACELLIKHRVYTVLGNHDRWLLEGVRREREEASSPNQTSLEWIKTLPTTLRFQTPYGRLLLCHGVGEDDLAELWPQTKGYALQRIQNLKKLMLDPDIQFMVGGHTHQRMVRTFSGLSVINAGTLHRNFESSFMILNFVDLQVLYYSLASSIHCIDTQPLPLPNC